MSATANQQVREGDLVTLKFENIDGTKQLHETLFRVGPVSDLKFGPGVPATENQPEVMCRGWSIAVLGKTPGTRVILGLPEENETYAVITSVNP